MCVAFMSSEKRRCFDFTASVRTGTMGAKHAQKKTPLQFYLHVVIFFFQPQHVPTFSRIGMIQISARRALHVDPAFWTLRGSHYSSRSSRRRRRRPHTYGAVCAALVHPTGKMTRTVTPKQVRQLLAEDYIALHGPEVIYVYPRRGRNRRHDLPPSA